MANFEERNTRREAQDSIFYERCWRCRCVVPNGLVRRRTLRTGYAKGTLVGTGAAVADLDHYEKVSLCGVCDDELAAREKTRLEKSGARAAWVCRCVGILFGIRFLHLVCIPLPLGAVIMVILARLRLVGRALLLFWVVTVVVRVLGGGTPSISGAGGHAVGGAHQRSGALAPLDCRLIGMAIGLVGTETAPSNCSADEHSISCITDQRRAVLMKPRPLTVRDYMRAVSRALTPVATRLATALTVTEYMRGQDSQHTDSHAVSAVLGGPRGAAPHHRRPGHQWPLENTWGYDAESERFERELWLEQTLYNDADFGVTYGESTWDGRWNNDEAWRR